MAPVNMCVDLRRRYVAMTEHLLQDTQVGPSLEHVRREAVTQGMRMQALDAHVAPVSLDELADATSREPAGHAC